MSPNPFARRKHPPADTTARTVRELASGAVEGISRHGVDLPKPTAERAGAKSTSPEGDADFAHVPAPAGAGTGPAHGAGTEADPGAGAERGLHQDQDPQTPAEPSGPAADAVVERFAPTVTADAFVHRGVAANDVPAPEQDDSKRGAERRRHLSDVLYRPRSGTKRALQLTCSAEPAERDFIDLAARKAKRSRSAYLMDCALTFAHAYLSDQRPDGVAALPSPQATQDLMVLFGKLIRDFGNVGNNLNQLVYTIHKGELPDRAEEILDELHQVARLARLLLDQALAGGGRRGA